MKRIKQLISILLMVGAFLLSHVPAELFSMGDVGKEVVTLSKNALTDMIKDVTREGAKEGFKEGAKEAKEAVKDGGKSLFKSCVSTSLSTLVAWAPQIITLTTVTTVGSFALREWWRNRQFAAVRGEVRRLDGKVTTGFEKTNNEVQQNRTAINQVGEKVSAGFYATDSEIRQNRGKLNQLVTRLTGFRTLFGNNYQKIMTQFSLIRTRLNLQESRGQRQINELQEETRTGFERLSGQLGDQGRKISEVHFFVQELKRQQFQQSQNSFVVAGLGRGVDVDYALRKQEDYSHFLLHRDHKDHQNHLK